MPNTEDAALFDVFLKYCQFGTRQPAAAAALAANGRRSSLAVPLMNGSKWAKLAREAALIDGSLITLTEVDILFNRVKDQAERRITFAQFKQALALLAEKKFAGDAEAQAKVISMVTQLEGPQLAAGTTLPTSSPTVERLMDGPANYISKSPREENRAWRENLRRSLPASPANSRRTSITLRKASLPVDPKESPQSPINEVDSHQRRSSLNKSTIEPPMIVLASANEELVYGEKAIQEEAGGPTVADPEESLDREARQLEKVLHIVD